MLSSPEKNGLDSPANIKNKDEVFSSETLEQNSFPTTDPWKRNQSGLSRKPSIIKDPSSKPSFQKKSVSFSRLPTESKILSASDCVSRMCREQQFMKLRSNTRVYNRVFWFEPEENCIRWRPSKKEPIKAKLDISRIRDIRVGKRTELFLNSDVARHFPDDISFSIILGEGKSLDLVADTASQVNVWVTGLRYLMSGKDTMRLKTGTDARDNWLNSVFDDADLNGDGFLDEEESFQLISNLSDGIRELSIKQILQEYLQSKINNKKKLAKDEFVQLFKDVVTRPEIYFILVRYSSHDDRLTVGDLSAFLEGEQGLSNVTKEDCLEIIKNFEPSEVFRSIPALGIDGFTKYLTSKHCNLFNPRHEEVCQDMTQPLSHYFIASSHNTYLMEDQLGPSNISAYIRALLRCCRSVELDCWDGPDGQPLVAHGHTRSNSIPFNHVINAINECAFHNSPYPVIIYIENHCSQNQQLEMARILTEILGKKIYTQTPKKDSSPLPSPESLRNRFLIRSRKLPTEHLDDIGNVTDDDEGEEVVAELTLQAASNESSLKKEIPIKAKEAKDKRLLVREFSDLVFLQVTSENLSVKKQSHSNQQTCSLEEEEANQAVMTSPEDFVLQTKKFLIRVYPSGFRHDSGNFNPQDYWNCGAQMAALNYQTPGLMMDINDGKFSMNGGCGYVMKPEVMRDELQYFDAEAKTELPGVTSKLLHLRVISGQNFPKPRGGGAKGHVIDPYVLIELFGFPADCSDQRTRTALNNSGDSSIFDELFEFKLILPSLALIRFVVLDDDFIGDEFIGQYTIPFDCLQPGYRHLKLRSLFDEPLDGASLFVHIAISEPDLGSLQPGTPTSNISPYAPRSSGKRGSQRRLKRQRSRKDIFSSPLYELKKPEIDNLFEGSKEALEEAVSTSGAFRLSLATFKEACGVSRLGTIKQCVRGVAKLTADQKLPPSGKNTMKVKRENGSKGTTSGGSSGSNPGSVKTQTSAELKKSTSLPRFIQKNRRVFMVVEGAVPEEWRRIREALDGLMGECLKVVDKALNCCNTLSSVHERAGRLREDFSEYLSRSESPSDVRNFEFSSGNGTIGKKQGKLKKQFLLVSESPKRRKSILDHFLWNCSVIKRRRDLLFSCHQQAEEILNDFWSACILYGLAEDRSCDDTNKSDQTSNKNSSNNNNNVDFTDRKSAVDESEKPVKNPTRSPREFKKSKSFLSRPKRQTKSVRRASSAEEYFVTLV